MCENNEKRRANVAAAEPTLIEVARRVDPTAFRQVVARWTCTVDPEAAVADEQELHRARYLSISSTFGGMVAVDGLLDPEGGALLLEAVRGLTRSRGPARTPGRLARLVPTRWSNSRASGWITGRCPRWGVSART